MEDDLTQHWIKTYPPRIYASPCIVMRAKNNTTSDERNTGFQILLQPNPDGTASLTECTYYTLIDSTWREGTPDRFVPLEDKLPLPDALRQIYKSLHARALVGQKEKWAIQTYKGRTIPSLEPDQVHPLSLLATENPEIKPLFDQLSSRWGSLASTIRKKTSRTASEIPVFAAPTPRKG